MILDTSLGSLLQTADFNIFLPKYMDDLELGARVQTPITVRELKVTESHKSKIKNARNSYAAVRVPGSNSKIAVFEHNSDTQTPSAIHNPALQDDWSGGGSSIM